MSSLGQAHDDVLFILRLINECTPSLRRLFKSNWERLEGTPWIDGTINLWELQLKVGEREAKRGKRREPASFVIKWMQAGNTECWDSSVLFHVLLWSGVNPLLADSEDRNDVQSLQNLRNAAAHVKEAELQSVASRLNTRWQDESNNWSDSCIAIVLRFTSRHCPERVADIDELIQRRVHGLWIKPDRLTLCEVIGCGAHSSVYRGTLKLGFQEKSVAVKVWRALPLQGVHDLQRHYEKEVKTLKRASNLSDFVCKMYGISKTADGSMCMVMKLYKGTLADKIRGTHNHRLAMREVLHYGVQIFQGLSELEVARIVVNDIKPENLLIDELDNLKIGDFGISKVLSTTGMLSSPERVQGTLCYMAPEMFEPDDLGGVGFPADIWAAAACMVEMISGERPFKDVANHRLAREVCDKKNVPSIPHGLPPSLESVLHDCFSFDQNSRPKAEHVAKELASILENTLPASSDAISSGNEQAHNFQNTTNACIVPGQVSDTSLVLRDECDTDAALMDAVEDLILWESHMMAEQDAQAMDRLLQRLQQYSPYSLQEVDDSGHCQFDAFAHQISARFPDDYPGGSLKNIRTVRAELGGWLRENADFPLANGSRLSSFLDSKDAAGWPAFCDRVGDADAAPPLWGNHLTLVAAANLYRRPIRVWMAVESDQWWFDVRPAEANAQYDRPLELAHVPERHYYSVAEPEHIRQPPAAQRRKAPGDSGAGPGGAESLEALDPLLMDVWSPHSLDTQGKARDSDQTVREWGDCGLQDTFCYPVLPDRCRRASSRALAALTRSFSRSGLRHYRPLELSQQSRRARARDPGAAAARLHYTWYQIAFEDWCWVPGGYNHPFACCVDMLFCTGASPCAGHRPLDRDERELLRLRQLQYFLSLLALPLLTVVDFGSRQMEGYVHTWLTLFLYPTLALAAWTAAWLAGWARGGRGRWAIACLLVWVAAYLAARWSYPDGPIWARRVTVSYDLPSPSSHAANWTNVTPLPAVPVGANGAVSESLSGVGLAGATNTSAA